MARARAPSRPPRRLPDRRWRDLVSPALATLAILLLFLGVFGPAHHDAAVLKARGVDAVATVTRWERVPGSGRSGPSVCLHYRFRAGEGWVEGERILRADEEDRLRGRRQVPVLYDPQAPSRSLPNLDDAVRRAHPDLAFALGIAAALAALASIWWLFLATPWRPALRLPDRA